jgi:hypothetical protein
VICPAAQNGPSLGNLPRKAEKFIDGLLSRRRAKEQIGCEPDMYSTLHLIVFGLTPCDSVFLGTFRKHFPLIEKLVS